MQAKRGLSEQGMNAFGRGTVRTVLLSGLSAIAIACAASFAFADPLQYLSPEAPPTFGDLADASPLVAVFTAHTNRSPALDLTTFAEPKFDLAPEQAPAAFVWNGHREERSDVAIQDRRFGPSSLDRLASARDDGGRSTETPNALEQAAPDNPPPVAYDPTVGPSLSPMQSALQAALWRLVASDDHRNPLGSGGDWRAARGSIAAFYASRAYAPVWVSETGLTEGARAALTQLKRASDDGLNLSAFALPHDLGSDLDPEEIAEAETTMASAVVAYAEQATGSRVPPARVSPLIFATPSIADPGAVLAETAAAANPAQRLANFNPPQKGYRALAPRNSGRRRTTLACSQRRS